VTREAVVAALLAEKVVPVLRFDSAELTERAVRCLSEVGFRTFEITLTTPDAVALIGTLSTNEKHVIGAGTVLDAAAGEECIEAGARFVVSPYVCRDLAKVAHDAGRAVLVGAFTPSEVMAAHRDGLSRLERRPGARAPPALGLPAHPPVPDRRGDAREPAAVLRCGRRARRRGQRDRPARRPQER
jgi:2-dehydro-3-deoxyphosphogluconate aldolase / (4S)-4-hydroxy-2-oxoglutarate aldolase